MTFPSWFLASALAASSPTETTAPTDMTAPTAVTSPTTGLGGVSDFGELDLEMATVSDFNQLDLETLLDAQVETASKKSESISRAPAIIEVLTRQQLYNLGARNLYDALSYLPGIEIVETHSGLTTVVMRGFMQEQYSVKVLMLINGHPTYEPVTSTFYLEIVPFESIHHIEVIRGPGSVLYGANAYAGVINVITETHAEDEVVTRARGEAGQYTTVSLGGGNSGRRGDLSWAVFASVTNGRGYPYHVRKEQDNDCIEGETPPIPYICNRPGNLAGRLSYYNNYGNAFGDVKYKGLRLQLGGVDQNKAKLGANPMIRLTGPQKNEHVWGDLSFQKEWDTVSFMARAGIDRDERWWGLGRFPDPSFLYTHVDNLSYLYRGESNISWTPFSSVTLDFGGSFERGVSDHFDFVLSSGAIHPISPDFDDTQPYNEIAAAYTQVNWRISDQFATVAGYRLTHFTTTAAVVNLGTAGVQTSTIVVEDPVINHSPRGGLVYSPRDDLAFKLLYGEAFRVPNLLETNAVLKTYLGSTPGLKPETIRTGELGIDSRPVGWLSLRANGYYSMLDDLITRRRIITADEEARFGAGAGLYSNSFKGTIYGFEISTIGVVTDSFNFFANLSGKRTFFEPKKPIYKFAGGKQGHLGRPEPAPLTANLGFSWKASSWLFVRPNGQYIGPRGYAKSYSLLNTVLDFPVTKAITLSAIGLNLLNKSYDFPEIVSRDTPTIPGGPNRAFYGRIVAQF